MEDQYSTLRLTIVLQLNEEYAIRIDPTGRPVYWQLWFGFQLVDTLHSMHAITLTGPTDVYRWVFFCRPMLLY